ncbi:MAG: NusA-like transcription termination signal-binding factor [Candidatus Woesearchaeota archaeon]
MTKIVYDMNTIKFISAFQTLTKTKLKDCIMTPRTLLFIVEEGELRKAVGKRALNVKMLAKTFNRKIKIVEFSTDVLKFVTNLIRPLQIKKIEEKEGIILITPPDTKTRGYLIGKGGSSLQQMQQIVKRHFDIKEIKVI